MANYKNRNLLLNTNKYQRQIIKVALIPSLAFCILISVFLLRFRFELIDAFLYGTRSISLQFIDQWLIMIILGVWAFFVFILYQTDRACAVKKRINQLKPKAQKKHRN